MNKEQRFGRLVVIDEDEPHISKSGRKYKKWICKCDCGNTLSVFEDNLKYNRTLSCGCFQKEE